MTISSPVCSAALCSSTCSLSGQGTQNGGMRVFYLLPKDFDCGCGLRGRRLLRLSTDRGLQRVPFIVQALKDPTECIGNSVEQSVRSPSLLCSQDGLYKTGTLHLQFIESPQVPTPYPDTAFVGTAEQSIDTGLKSLEYVDAEKVLAFDETSKGLVALPESMPVDNDFLSGLKSSIEGSSSGVNALSSTNEAVEKIEYTWRSRYDSAASFVDGIFKKATSTIDSSVDQIEKSAANRYDNFSSDLKQAANQAAAASIDLLRSAVAVLEDSLIKGAPFIVYSYNSSKEVLPLELRESLKIFEEKTAEFGKPVVVAGQQVYLVVEQLERTLALDPSDPLVPFLLFLGLTSAF